MGTCQFSPTRAYCIEGKWLSVWEAFKALTIKLNPLIQVLYCHHSKGHGCIQALNQVKSNYPKFFKSDIDSYYASINHEILLNQLRCYTKCQKLMDIFKQYLRRVEIKCGHT
jgi:RNA-directed DNA polymerase